MASNTNRTKFIDDIRAIVGIDPNQSSLDADLPKTDIPGYRGVAYVTPAANATGGSTQDQTDNTDLSDILGTGDLASLGGSTGATSDTGSGSNDPSGKTAQQKGNTPNPNSPHGNIYQGDQGTTDITKIIDNQPGSPFASSWGTVGNQQIFVNNGGTLNGISGAYDCGSGKSLDIRMDGLLRPPPGWYQAGTPDALGNVGPLGYLTWEAGVQWQAPWAVSGGPSIATTAEEAAKAARDASGDGDKTDIIDRTLDTSFPHSGGTIRWIFTFQNPSNMHTAQYYAQDESCSASSSDPLCPLTSPVKWPGDGMMQIVRQADGSFAPAVYENPGDIIPKFTDGVHSRIDFCFDGGRTGSIIPAINGGYMITETLTSGGTPEGIVRLFSADNKVVAYLNATNYTAYTVR